MTTLLHPNCVGCLSQQCRTPEEATLAILVIFSGSHPSFVGASLTMMRSEMCKVHAERLNRSIDAMEAKR